MCGITGIYSRGGVARHQRALRAANDAGQHRGPDGAGFALFDFASGPQPRIHTSPHGDGPDRDVDRDLKPDGEFTLGLGHRRLSILDLGPGGHQPMAVTDPDLWVTYNGEIYNYLELRAELEGHGHRFHTHCDTEVLLRSYAQWGDGCLERFNGMWAFALVDVARRRLFCARDRLGVKPFHYWADGTHFAFASEIKQLLQYPFVNRRINEQTVYDFLKFGATDYCSDSFFESVRRLEPSHKLVLDLDPDSGSGTPQVSRYYTPEFAPQPTATPADAAAQYKTLFTDSVRLRLRSDVEVGSCLSGGLDSSSIVCTIRDLLASSGGGNQATFSCHFADPVANEREYMEEVIRQTSVRPHFVEPTSDDLLGSLERVVWHQEEPFASTSIFAQWWVYELTHQHRIKVMLDGQGADEMLAGYRGLVPSYFAELAATGQSSRLRWERLRHAWLDHGDGVGGLTRMAWQSLARRFGPRHNQTPTRRDWLRPEATARFEGDSPYLATQQVQPFGPDQHLANALYQMTYVNNLQALFKYQDRSSMAFSVEGRVPFADVRLCEFTFGLPSQLKIRNGYTKRVLRDAMAGVLPDKIRWRIGKLGFATPESRWQQGPLRQKILAALHDRRVGEFVDPAIAREHLDDLQHQRTTDFAPWRWLSLRLWMDSHGL